MDSRISRSQIIDRDERATASSGFAHVLAIGLACLSVFLLAASAKGVTASPHAFVEEQPDGSHVELYMRGDEYRQWIEDGRGFTVVRHEGRYVYGELAASGEVVGTDLVVGRDDPGAAGLQKRIQPTVESGSALRGHNAFGAFARPSPRSGTVRNLVVMMRFADHAGRAVPTRSEVDVLFNARGGDARLAPTGSVRDAFDEYSYGQLDLESTVAYWIDLPQTEAYYAAGNSGLTSRTHEAIRYALDTLEADPAIRFSDFDRDGDGDIDAITFLHSGYGAEWGGTDADGANYTDRIWSHKWSIGRWVGQEGVAVSSYHISPALWATSGNAIGRIGVICHETGHFFGLPDLYDPDGGGQGIGSYGLMANSWGFDGSQHYPPHPSAWSKVELGWANPVSIGEGTHTLPQAESSAAILRVDAGFPSGEYLLIENRQPAGLDGTMPRGGLAVWHVDERASDTTEGHPGQVGWPENGRHYRVALLQADGDFDMERGHNRGDSGDLYHGNGSDEIGPDTMPNTDAYQRGLIIETGHRIGAISLAGAAMRFRLGDPIDAPACDDGLDNDGDGRIDMEDPGCPDPSSTTESPACDDGLDNDGDGYTDWADPRCSEADPSTEHPFDLRDEPNDPEDPPSGRGCGSGFALGFLLPALAPGLRILRRRRHPRLMLEGRS